MKRKERANLVSSVRNELIQAEINHIELHYRPKKSTADMPIVRNDHDMYRIALSYWDPLKLGLCEQFKVCLLNTKMRVLGICDISTGGIRTCDATVSFILAAALLANASNIILLHNHPSGTCDPAQADLEATEQIIDAAAPFGIVVSDHMIISDSGYYSFLEKNLFPASKFMDFMESLRK